MTTQICRLPGYGEGCSPDAGCAASPPGMVCSDASFAGSSQELCLVPCNTATDSSACPYGMSCGDPNLPGYCSPQGPGTCSPWTPCSLGSGLIGLCVPSGQGVSCVAAGTVAQAFEACNPQASNAEAAQLCANGMLCEPAANIPLTLGTAPASSGGFCVPPCGVYGAGATGEPVCADNQHCVQTAGSSYGLCLPGSACSLGGSQPCEHGWWCLPDSFEAESGGCVGSADDAGAAGDSCQPAVGFTTTNPCQPGNLCLPNPGGATACQTVCLITPATSQNTACETGLCTAVEDGGVLGVCE
jgi:hypothetical protein